MSQQYEPIGHGLGGVPRARHAVITTQTTLKTVMTAVQAAGAAFEVSISGRVMITPSHGP